jgi:hypothetical protein
MISLSQISKTALRVAGVAVLLAVPSFADGISATATYTSTPDATPGLYDYNLTLNNTGTTTIGTLWFAWVPGGDFLSPSPTNVISPAGWTFGVFNNATNTGTSVRWVTTTALLQAGQSLSGFNFTSAETPEQLLGDVLSGTGAGDPILTTFVYIGAPLKDPGAQFVPVAQTPEPGSLALLATGLLGGAGTCYRRFKGAKAA